MGLQRMNRELEKATQKDNLEVQKLRKQIEALEITVRTKEKETSARKVELDKAQAAYNVASGALEKVRAEKTALSEQLVEAIHKNQKNRDEKLSSLLKEFS